jgi:hypothetical protein
MHTDSIAAFMMSPSYIPHPSSRGTQIIAITPHIKYGIHVAAKKREQNLHIFRISIINIHHFRILYSVVLLSLPTAVIALSV